MFFLELTLETVEEMQNITIYLDFSYLLTKGYCFCRQYDQKFLDADVNIIGNLSCRQLIDRYSLTKSTVFTLLAHFRTGVVMCEHNGRPT